MLEMGDREIIYPLLENMKHQGKDINSKKGLHNFQNKEALVIKL